MTLRWIETEDHPAEPLPLWLTVFLSVLVGVCIGYLIWG